jgi:hypothetical protein
MPDHLSYSSISLYLDCPEAWRRKYIANEPTKTSTALAFGSAFHETVESLVADPESKYEFLPIWREKFTKQFATKIDMEESETQEQHFNEGIRLLTFDAIKSQILSIKPAKDENGKALIEQKVELRVPGVSLPVIGYIDIVLHDGTPADFKTSAKSWSENQAAGSLQTLFYLAALNQMGREVNWRFQHIIFVKTKTPQIQVMEHTHQPSELFFLFDVIKRVWDGISKEVFVLNPTSWKCSPKYCDFYLNCKGKY